MSVIVLLVAGWREAKLKRLIRLLGGKETAVNSIFLLLWTISKWISLLLQNVSLFFCSEAARLARDTRRPVCSSRVAWEGEHPPSASLLWSFGCRAAAPQCSTSSRAPLDPPSVSRSSSSKSGQSPLSAAHGISNPRGGGEREGSTPAVALPPSLSS